MWVNQDEVNLRITKDKECSWKSYPILALSRLGEYVIIRIINHSKVEETQFGES